MNSKLPDLLNKTQGIIQFDVHGLTCGVTTRKLGNLKAVSPDFKSNIIPVKRFCGAWFLNMIIPNHLPTTVEVSPSNKDMFYPGDAIFMREQGRILGLIHCSWITLAEKIVSLSLDKMFGEQEVPFPRLHAFVFPGICQNCYEVQGDVKMRFDDPGYDIFFKPVIEGRWLLDLSGLIIYQLRSYGLLPSHIRTIPSCSSHSCIHNADGTFFPYYSYRSRAEMERNLIFAKFADSPLLLASTTGDCPYIILYG